MANQDDEEVQLLVDPPGAQGRLRLDVPRQRVTSLWDIAMDKSRCMETPLSRSHDFSKVRLVNVSFEGYPFDVVEVDNSFVYLAPFKYVYDDPEVLQGPQGPVPTLLQRLKIVDLLLCIGGIALFALLNEAMLGFLKYVPLPVPSAVLALFVMFAYLLLVEKIFGSEKAEDQVHYFAYSVAFLNRWLGMFFVPSLVTIPQVGSLISGADIPKVVAIIVGTTIITLPLAGWVGTAIMNLTTSPETDEASKGAGPASSPPPLPSGTMMLSAGVVIIVGWCALAVMRLFSVDPPGLFFCTTWFIWLGSMVLSYCEALHLQRRVAGISTNLAKICQPVVICTLFTMLSVLAVGAFEGQEYLVVVKSFKRTLSGLYIGDLIHFLLTPAVISMAFGMYRQKAKIKANLAVVLLLTFFVALGSMVLAAVLLRIANVSNLLKASLIPHTATTPLAMEATMALSKEFGNPQVAASGAVSTGVVGALLGRLILTAVSIQSPVVRGLTVGGCAHGIGTGMLVSEEPESAPFGAIGFAFTGSFVAILASIPSVANFLWYLAG